MSGFIRQELEHTPYVADFLRTGHMHFLVQAFRCYERMHGPVWDATRGRPAVSRAMRAVEDVLNARQHGAVIAPRDRELWALRLHFLVNSLVNASE